MNRSFSPAIARIIVIANTLLVLVVVNLSIAKKQSVVESGSTVFLKLAPVDPRSLMQGDYMVLGYDLNRNKEVRDRREVAPTRGQMILSLDGKRAAVFDRFADDGEEAGENEMALNYRKARRGFRFGIESFFFEEGMAKTYSQARFAELRVSDDGVPVLVDLLGENLKPLTGDGGEIDPVGEVATDSE